MDHSKVHHSDVPMGSVDHDHHEIMIDDFRRKFYLALLLTIPVMLLSPMIQHW